MKRVLSRRWFDFSGVGSELFASQDALMGVNPGRYGDAGGGRLGIQRRRPDPWRRGVRATEKLRDRAGVILTG